MENQTITPNQNNTVAPAPSPALNNPFNTPQSSSAGKLGRLSLTFSLMAVGIFILLIFVSNLIDSLAKAYVWFFVILVLGVVGLAMGLLSEKRLDKISLTGLLGIIVSVIVCVNCLVVGSYYIKLRTELNRLDAQFNSSNSTQSFDYNFSSD